jgi:hypothetical protein
MRDPQTLRIYHKSFDDQTIRAFDLSNFDYDSKDVQRLSMAGPQPVADMTDKFTTEKTAVAD